MPQQRHLGFDDEHDRSERYMSDAPVHHQASSTSARSARNLQPKIGTKRWAVLTYVAAQGERGTTRNEMERADPRRFRICSICSPVKTLLEGGYIQVAGERRDRDSGQANEVLTATELGLRTLRLHSTRDRA